MSNESVTGIKMVTGDLVHFLLAQTSQSDDARGAEDRRNFRRRLRAQTTQTCF